MEFVLINFRVKPHERQQLRITLLQKGKTLQEFFAGVVERELDNVRPGLIPIAAGDSAGRGNDGE